MAILVTGAAGFIGYHVCQALLEKGESVFGIDNLNDYYTVSLKQSRLERLKHFPRFHFSKRDIADMDGLKAYVLQKAPERILHLAAQAGVRYSLKNPHAYVHSNLVGHVAVLEAARALQERQASSFKHLVYASSSSVYGECKTVPFQESFRVDHPVSLYAATKKANELISHSYTHLYGLAQTGLRFFTVYGAWGRPDMAYWLFTNALIYDQPIAVFNYGKMERDFTYIGDVIPVLIRCLYDTPSPATHQVFNLGGANPVPLEKMIQILENLTGKKAKTVGRPMQPGDVKKTFADVSAINKKYGLTKQTSLKKGLKEFVDWYQNWITHTR